MLGFYSNTLTLGGSEFYLKDLLVYGVRQTQTRIVLFCNTNHPLTSDLDIQEFCQQESLKIILIDDFLSVNPSKSFLASSLRIETQDKVSSELTFKDKIKKCVPNSVKLFLGTIKDICGLRRLFLKHKVNLLHFNDTGCEPAVIAARWAGIKKITGTFHVLPNIEPEKNDWVRRSIEFFSVRSMDKAIAVSSVCKKEWSRRTRYSLGRIHLIYNGIDTNKFSSFKGNIEEKRRKLGFDIAKILIGVPARLHPLKGHSMLFKAIASSKNDFNNVLFLLIGDGPYRSFLEKEIESLGIKENIIFLGHRSDIADIYQVLNFVVLPTLYEAFNLTILEAMACEKPVIVSDLESCREAVDQGINGSLVSVNQLEDWRLEIKKFIENPDQTKVMGMRSREKVLNHFDIQRTLEKTWEFLCRMQKGEE